MQRTVLAAFTALCLATPALAADLTLDGGFSRVTPGSGPGVAYVTIHGGDAPDRLVKVTSPRAPKVEMHTMTMQGDIMRMREVDAIDVPAGATVKLAPGGLHLMLMGMAAPLKAGETLPLVLTFEHAGTKAIDVPVEPLGRWRRCLAWEGAFTRVAILGAVLLTLGAAPLFDRTPRWATDRPGQVAQGRQVYAAQCASCHGAALQGQPHWWEPGADGLLPAPPHDATGHSWQHSDRELTELVEHSVASFAPPGYRTAMPAFAGRLSPTQVAAVIAYIKSTWPAGIRAYQAAQNPGGPALASLGPGWVFPATCGYHLQPQ